MAHSHHADDSRMMGEVRIMEAWRGWRCQVCETENDRLCGWEEMRKRTMRRKMWDDRAQLVALSKAFWASPHHAGRFYISCLTGFEMLTVTVTQWLNTLFSTPPQLSAFLFFLFCWCISGLNNISILHHIVTSDKISWQILDIVILWYQRWELHVTNYVI